MKILVGLGNPGEKYSITRHNTGFMLLDKYALENGLSFTYESKFLAEIAHHKEKDLLLVKPQAYMNNSGESIAKILNFYKVGLDDLVVVHDEVDLEFGRTKTVRGAGSAGHKGVENIIMHLGSSDFTRVRVGVGRPQNRNILTDDWVLSDFSAEEKEKIQETPLPIG